MRGASRSRRFLPIAIAGAVAMVLLLTPLPDFGSRHLPPALLGEIENLGHPLLFAFLALLGTRTVRPQDTSARQGATLLLAAGLLIFAAMTEVLQPLTGRDGAWEDLAGNLLGILFGLLWPLRHRAARLGAGFAALLACLPLVSTLAAYAWRYSQSPVIWTSESRLLNRFAHWQVGPYPGLVLDEVPGDWSAWSALVLTVHNPGMNTTSFTVRIHDAFHNQRHEDRFNRSFQLPAGATTSFDIPLRDVAAAPSGRSLDLSAVAGLIVFQHAGEAGPHVQPTLIRLVPGDPAR